jgi:hypothetical protein
MEEFHEKCLLSYSGTHDSVVQNTPLPSILLHGQSEDVEPRTTAHLVHKTIHEAFTNHNKVLANTIGNVLKEVFLERQLIKWDQHTSMALILRLWEATYLVLVSSRMVDSSKPPIQQFPRGQAQDQTLQAAGARSSPANRREARSDDRGQLPAQQSPSAPVTQIVQQPTR